MFEIRNPKLIQLTIEDIEAQGMDMLSLVANPAIEEEFFAFAKQEFESYNDYPKKAVANAKRGIELNKKNGNKCAQREGKLRAQQFVNGENMTLDTIKRLRAFLIRQKDNYDLAVSRKDYNACGYISYMLWGGPDALPWAEKKLRQAGLLEAKEVETFDAEVEATLKSKVKEFNAKYKKELGYGVNISMLKAVYKRGLETERGSFARVNAFLHIVKTGKPANKKYTADFDLLPTKHPKRMALETIISYMEKLQKVLDYIDDVPVFATPQEATAWATEHGMEGYHTHEVNGVTVYMPGESHDDAIDKKLAKYDKKIKEDTKQRRRPYYASKFASEGDVAVATKFSMADEEKQMLISPVMIPNKPIIRVDEFGEPYYVYFTSETIEKMSHKFMAEGLTDALNLEHAQNNKLSGVTIVESWIKVDDNDKSTKYNMEHPVGTWYVQLKVTDKVLWDMVKNGNLNGVSLEGRFGQKRVTGK